MKTDKPRTGNGARFAPEWSEDDYIDAVKKCLSRASVTAAEVAEEMGCSPKNAKIHLQTLADQGKIKAELKGKGWGFRLPDSE